jgi:hypothetical protein
MAPIRQNLPRPSHPLMRADNRWWCSIPIEPSVPCDHPRFYTPFITGAGALFAKQQIFTERRLDVGPLPLHTDLLKERNGT